MNRRYPEWFVGGPWHGKDKKKECPHLQSMVRVASVSLAVRDMTETSEPVGEIETLTEEYVYVPKRADVFGEDVVIWIGDHEDPRPYVNGEPSTWVQLFGQLLMSPHRLSGSIFVEQVARIHRERWEIEREVRHELEARYREELTRLRSQVRRSVPSSPYRGDEYSIQEEENDAVLYSAKIGDEPSTITMTNIVFYEDPGDEQHAPGWVATAMGPAKSPDGSWDDVGFTGYGPDKPGALLALMADRLGYYARVTPYGEKGRMR